MADDFTDVVTALSRSPEPATSQPGRPRKVTVLGAGPVGRALAAWLLAEGVEEVTLFTVYSEELDVLSAGSITIRGEGPIGSFRIGEGGIDVTSVLDTAVAEADALFVTGPVFKLRTYGMVLAPHLSGDQLLVVLPACTFGGLEVEWWLEVGGWTGTSTLVEMTGLPFDIYPEGSTLHLERGRPALVGVRPAHRGPAVEWLTDILSDLVLVPTLLHASFADASGLVEVPALLLGGPAAGEGETLLPAGAVPLAAPGFASLLGPRTETLIDSLAAERRAVAGHFGVRDLPSTQAWIQSVAGGDAPSDTRRVPGPAGAEAAVREGVLGSLVPLISAARLAGVPVPTTQSVVQTAAAALGADLASAGRTLEGIGFARAGTEAVRRAVGVGGADGR